MSDDEEVIEGVGYLYQGAWLGVDRTAFKPIKLAMSRIEGMEEDNYRGTPYIRAVTKTGATWIIFRIEERRPIRAATLKSQSATPALPEKASRIFYLPANLPRYDEEK